MTNRLQTYDIISAFVPGVLLLCVIGVTFPGIFILLTIPGVPDTFTVLALTILSLFLGHIIQAVTSLLEPALHFTWGGRPSEKALEDGLGERYLPKATIERIKGNLKAVLEDDASNRSIFLYAMSVSETDSTSRVSLFNGSYAYHRALLMLTMLTGVLAAFSWKYGSLKSISCGQFSAIIAVLLALSLLLWYRCRQRAFYYVREVLGTAERLLATSALDSIKKIDKLGDA